MAVLKKIKENFGGAAAGAMMLGAVAMPFASASAADGKISYADLRSKSAEVNKLVPALASGKGRVALKVLGGTPALNKAIYLSAQKIEKNIDRDIAFLHAKDDNAHDNKTKVEIWVSGYKTGTLSFYGADLVEEQLTAVINGGIERVQEARKTASLDQAKPGKF